MSNNKNPFYLITTIQQDKLKIDKLISELALIMDMFGYEVKIEFIKKEKLMSNNKQSSVNWLYNELLNCELTIENCEKALEQAKAMHKEEQKKAYNAKLNNWYFDFEKYYKETFNNDGNPNN